MTERIDNGGPAFPAGTHVLFDEDGHVVPWGMSKREWYAGQALMSLPHLCARDSLPAGKTFEEYIATNAFAFADAMIAAEKERLNG
jgi:hypothetical protein